MASKKRACLKRSNLLKVQQPALTPTAVVEKGRQDAPARKGKTPTHKHATTLTNFPNHINEERFNYSN